MNLRQALRAPRLPPATPLARPLDLALSGALAALGFFLPFSVAGTSIMLAVLMVIALMAAPAVWRSAPWRDPVVAVGLLLFAYITGHTLWTSGLTVAAWGTINRYHELLMAAVLLALFRLVSHRKLFFRGLACGALFYAAAHWAGLAWPPLASYLEARRISAGLGLSLCGFMLLEQARGSSRPWMLRALAAFLALTVLFAINGRTGYLVLLLLVACAAWLQSPRRWRWGAMIALPLAVIALALASTAVQTRVKETLAGTSPMVQGMPNSTGIRIELLNTGLDLARRYFIEGAGYAEYAMVHEPAAKARYGADPMQRGYLEGLRPSNPHNEYLMQLVGGGIAALVLFMAWLALPILRESRSPGVRASLIGVSLAFAMGCLFNSLLMDFVEGHLYVALMTWLLAQSGDPAAKTQPLPAFKRILVIATRQIGDVLLTTPLIRAARERWPQAQIDVLGFAGTQGMLRGNPDISALIESPPRLGWVGFWSLLRKLWRRYDLALVTQAGDRPHLMGWIAARRRSGVIPERGGSNWWKKTLLLHSVQSAGDRGDVHVVIEKLSLLAPWPAPEQALPRMVVPAPAALTAQDQAQLRPGAVVLHAPSMWPYKQWPLMHFRALAAALLAQGRQVVLTGSAGAHDQACVAALRDLAPPPQLLDFSGRLDFNQLTTLFGQAALYIGPDTSVSHLAAAAGIPVIAILGPTNPMRWAPWPKQAGAQVLFQRVALVQTHGNVTVLQGGGLVCVPCGRAGCEDHAQSRSDCLVAITPERVLEQALRLLKP